MAGSGILALPQAVVCHDLVLKYVFIDKSVICSQAWAGQAFSSLYCVAWHLGMLQST